MRDIGKKIRELREQKGLTQEELAHRVGYKSRASINKIELQRDIPISKVSLIADALGVTPAYIMGWDECDYVVDISDDGTSYVELCKESKNLSDERIKFLLDIIKTWKGSD